MYKLIAIAGLFASLLFTTGEAQAQTYESCTPVDFQTYTDFASEVCSTVTPSLSGTANSISSSNSIKLTSSLDFLGGDDVIELTANSDSYQSHISIGDGVIVSFGAGNDKLDVIYAKTNLEVNAGGLIDFGADDDELIFKGALADIYGTINFGTGNDVLENFHIFTVETTGRVDFGAGDDTFYVYHHSIKPLESFIIEGVVDLGADNDRLYNEGAIVLSGAGAAKLLFGAGNDVLHNGFDVNGKGDANSVTALIHLEPGAVADAPPVMDFGAGDDIINNGFLSSTVSADGTITIGDTGHAFLLLGAGNDIINNGFYRAAQGADLEAFGKGIINIHDVLDLGAGDDVLNNEKGSEIHFKSFFHLTVSPAPSLLFGAGDDVLNNRGTITFQQHGSLIDFGTGNDRLINAESGVISITEFGFDAANNIIPYDAGTFSIINGVVENAGVISLIVGSTLVMDTYIETGTGNIKIKPDFSGAGFVNLDIKETPARITLDIDIGSSTIAAGTTSFTLFALSKYEIMKNVRLNAAGATALRLTNPQIVSLMVKQSDNTFSHQLVAQENPLALPTIGYDIATKASLDCSTALVCKGINTAISSTVFDSTTLTLTADGFAVDGGHAYFAKTAPLLTLTTAVDTKVQIHGLVYVGNVSATAVTTNAGEANEATTYPLTLGAETTYAFAEISGGGNFELTNYGAIIGSGDALISLTDLASGKIYNEGSISAAKAAIKITDATGAEVYQITNKGSIGSDGEAIIAEGGVITIDNSGGIGSSIELVANAQGGDGKHATIHIGDNATANANAVTIINRKGGRIGYRIGSLDGSTPPDSTPIYVASLSALKIYNAGDIIISKSSDAASNTAGYAIFWNGNTGSIFNTGRIIGIESAIHITGSTASATSDITIHNNGLIKSSEDTINIDNAAHKVSIFNYEDGTISGGGAGETIRVQSHAEFYLTNHGLITGGGASTILLNTNRNTSNAVAAHNSVIYNTGRILSSKGERGRAIQWRGSGFLFNIGTDALISGDAEAIFLERGRSSNADDREVFTLINSGKILSSVGYGIRAAGNTNTSILVDNVGVISGATSGIFVNITTAQHSIVNAKVDILNKAGGGIYGDESAIHIVSLGADDTKNTVAEKLVITNDGDIFSKDITINIAEIIGALDITNGPNGAIVAKTNELDREAYDGTIAINISDAGSGGAVANYAITNMGRILSNSIAYRALGIGHLNNTGFILGDIIVAGDGSTLINRVDADNDFKKDLFGKVGDRSYSFLRDPSQVASGVIIGNIYFYDRSLITVVENADGTFTTTDTNTAKGQTLTNSGIIYGNIDFGKGNDTYNHEGNGRVEGTVTLGAGEDTLNVNSGTMYLNVARDRLIAGDKFIFDSFDKIIVNNGGTLVMNINSVGTVFSITTVDVKSGGKFYLGNLSMKDFIINTGDTYLIDFDGAALTLPTGATFGLNFRFDDDFMLWAQLGDNAPKIRLITTAGGWDVASPTLASPVIMDIDFEVNNNNEALFATYKGLDFTNAGSLPGAPADASKFADYLQRLLQAEELFKLPAGESLISSLIQVDDLGTYIARLEEALGTANYDSLLSDLSEISAVSSFVDDFTSANCAVRDTAYQSLVVSHEESGCSWTSFTERSVGGRDEQAITSGRQSPLGDNWVSMVAAQYKKVELVDSVEGHARDSETYLLGAGLRSRAPIANVAEVSVSLTMGRGEHRRNREWASVQQASMPEMNFQMVRIGASRSFALPLKGSWKITPSTDYNLVRVDVSDLQHEAVAGDSIFAIDDMEHNRQSVRASLELRGEHESQRGSTIAAFARIGVEHYITGRSAGYSIRLVGASEGFTYAGRAIDENVLTTSFGITSKRGKTVSFRAFYEGKQGINGIYENHEAKMELLKRF